MAEAVLATPAWLMAGRLRNVPGALVAGEGRLAFVGDDGPVFNVAMNEVTDVGWPWYWFGGGCRLAAAGEKYKITFVRPNGAPPVSPSLLRSGASLHSMYATLTEGPLPAGAVSAVSGLFDVRSGRQAGRAWKGVLPAG
jgi:hypothetical protein